jgi:RNA polymerase sigma factor (sigma-70 family)
MRVAQHWSLCRDDALDAYQRALEIYVRRLDSLDPATEIAWMKVVVKHEALAVRRQRAEALPVEDVDFDLDAAEAQRPVDDLLAGRERVRRSAEALRRLKPDEARALVLKAQGLSYREIGEKLQWTYTKVNRCITEGRARFLKVYAEIEAGEECDRFAPTLAALVAGTASADALLELRPHIRNCATCRATVRELHATRLGRLAALLPIPALVVPLRWVSGRFGEGAVVTEPGPDGIVLGPGTDVPELTPVEGITDLYDVIAPLEPRAHGGAEQPGRLVELKAHVYEWLHRLQGSDVATTGAQIAAGTGGGRIATVGAVIGLCLSGLGAGTVCLITGVVQNPFAQAPAEHADARPKPKVRAEARRRPKPPAPVVTAAPARAAAAAADAKPQPGRPAPSRKRPTTPSTHEQAQPAPAPAGATRDFTFEQTAPGAPSAPASAPTNGGGEFAP